MFILGFIEEALMFAYGHLLDNKALGTSFVQWSDTHGCCGWGVTWPSTTTCETLTAWWLILLCSLGWLFSGVQWWFLLCLTTAGGCRVGWLNLLCSWWDPASLLSVLDNHTPTTLDQPSWWCDLSWWSDLNLWRSDQVTIVSDVNLWQPTACYFI
jgi:hypothetical protein